MKKSVVSTLCGFFLALLFSCPAFAQELVAGGQIVGIEIDTEGILVAGVGEVETEEGSCCPAEEAGLKEGDIIKEINGRVLDSAVDLVDMVCEADGEAVRLKVLRDGKIMRFNLQPAKAAEEQWRLGMWLKDGISGLGTVTFYDPERGIYGALGHGISELKSGKMLPVKNGKISEAKVSGVIKGKSGTPGELNGASNVENLLGNVENNSPNGIFGHAAQPFSGKTYMTGEFTTGPASIISTIKDGQARQYSVEINRVYRDEKGGRVLLTVNDPELCSLTGGIVQGMSGSPIIQNGKLVGAVTHVFVNDPRRGYGISIENMLDAAG